MNISFFNDLGLFSDFIIYSNITVIWKPEIQIFKYPFEIEMNNFPVHT